MAMKMNRLISLVGGFAVLVLVGCSLKLEVALFNNSGKEMVAHADRSEIPLGKGVFVKFYYPGEAQQWTFRLSTRQCEYVYLAPKSLEHYPWPSGSREPLKAQVEPDFSIHLLPPTANGVRVISEHAALQQDGFPLHPVSTSCR
jgi:hypothetical protein